MTGLYFRSCALRGLAVCLIACLAYAVTPPSVSLAQDAGALIKPKSSGSFSFFGLFKSGTKKRKVRSKTSTRRSSEPRAQRIVAKTKDEDASVILVVGDQMADGLADGLDFLLADKTSVRIERIVLKNSGLIAGQSDAWVDEIQKQLVSEDNLRAVVVSLGQSDLNHTIESASSLKYGTVAWQTAYSRRVRRVIESVRDQRKSLLWVGLPPAGKTSVSSSFAMMNDIYRDRSETARGYFVDIWDVFLNDAGEYSSYGPDVTGKNKLLRSSDKIGFTRAGFQKVAFFVERKLSRILGGYGALAFEGVEDDPNFIVLTGRTTSPERELLGGDSQETGARDKKESEAYRFFVKGDVLPEVPGRVDATGITKSTAF